MSSTDDAVKHIGTADAVKHGGTADAVKHIGTADAVKHGDPADRAVKHHAGAQGTRYELAATEAARMAQLSAEVAARLAEMARIFAATTNVSLGGMSPRYVPATESSDADITRVEIVCGPDGCGCYVILADGTGWCEFPCGG